MRPHEAQPARGGEAASADWPAYAVLARMAFQRQLAYRFANVSGLLTNGFFGLLRAYVLIALFGARHAGRVAGYSICVTRSSRRRSTPWSKSISACSTARPG